VAVVAKIEEDPKRPQIDQSTATHTEHPLIDPSRAATRRTTGADRRHTITYRNLNTSSPTGTSTTSIREKEEHDATARRRK
jgi:hypothetical protein